MTNKRDKFEDLDNKVLDAMIKALDKGDTAALRDLNVAVTYLKNNQVVTPPKEEDSIHDKIKDALDN